MMLSISFLAVNQALLKFSLGIGVIVHWAQIVNVFVCYLAILCVAFLRSL